MTIYLHKILPLLVSPLMVISLLVLWAAISRRRGPGLCALVLLWALSLPIVSGPLIGLAEHGQQRLDPTQVPPAQAIVVLGGVTKAVPSSWAVPPAEWNEASDRFFAALDLYRAGKAPRVIFTAGMLPWHQGPQTEGAILAQYAALAGIPTGAIAISARAENTAQEARAVLALFNQNRAPRILLVTSAFHMARAQKLFERQGFDVIPYAVDFRRPSVAVTPMDFLPSARALQQNDTMIREWIGRAYYALHRP
jgi:uncharacterized SAM-binding protein YcdF (DUF218 family)